MNLPPIADVVEKLRDAVAPTFTVSALLLGPFLVARRGQLAPLGAALAMAAALAVGNYFSPAVPWEPESYGRGWVLAAAGIALAVGLVARVPQIPAVIGWLLRAAAAGAAAWLCTSADLRAAQPWAIYACGAAILANWAVLELLATNAPGGAVPLAALAACFSAAGVLIQASFASMTDISIFATGALLAIGLTAWLRPADVGGALPAVAVLLPVLLLAGRFDTATEVPDTCFVLVSLAPTALGPLLIPPFKRWTRLRRGVMGSILIAIPLAIAAVRALQAPVPEF